MTAPGHYTAFVLIALAALAGGIALGLKVPGKRAGWALVPFVLALVLYAICRARPEWEAGLFPWPGYAYWQRQWIYPLGLYTLGVGGSLLPLRWNRWTVWTVAGGLLVWSLFAGSWMLSWPCPGRTDMPVRGRVVEQSTGYTCAPAACATLLAAWGIERSEHEMAQLCLCVPGHGTAKFDVYRGLMLGAKGSGLRARIVRVRREDLGRLVLPFTIGTGNHAIVIFRVEKERLLVGDPFVPRPAWRPSEQVLDDWDGLVVLLCRTGPFDGQDAPYVGEWAPGKEDG